MRMIGSQTASGENTMNMGMEKQALILGVRRAEETDFRS